LNSARRLNGWHLIAAYIPVQAEAGKAAMVAAVPGVLETASLAGPCGIIARAQAHDTGELANLCPDTIDQARDAAEAGLKRVSASSQLCFAFLAHTGLSL